MLQYLVDEAPEINTVNGLPEFESITEDHLTRKDCAQSCNYWDIRPGSAKHGQRGPAHGSPQPPTTPEAHLLAQSSPLGPRGELVLAA